MSQKLNTSFDAELPKPAWLTRHSREILASAIEDCERDPDYARFLNAARDAREAKAKEDQDRVLERNRDMYRRELLYHVQFMMTEVPFELAIVLAILPPTVQWTHVAGLMGVVAVVVSLHTVFAARRALRWMKDNFVTAFAVIQNPESTEQARKAAIDAFRGFSRLARRLPYVGIASHIVYATTGAVILQDLPPQSVVVWCVAVVLLGIWSNTIWTMRFNSAALKDALKRAYRWPGSIDRNEMLDRLADDYGEGYFERSCRWVREHTPWKTATPRRVCTLFTLGTYALLAGIAGYLILATPSVMLKESASLALAAGLLGHSMISFYVALTRDNR